MLNEQPNYYAVIPANVRYDKRLNGNQKLLFGEISALANKTGQCWATNKYFAELYNVSIASISQWIGKLKECGYIESSVEYKEGSKEILHRYIRILIGGIQENFNTPIKENLKDNNTSTNNTRLIIEHTRVKFSKPSVDAILAYIGEIGAEVDANMFFDYYESNGWKVAGKAMVDWKAALRNWNRRDLQKKKEKILYWKNLTPTEKNDIQMIMDERECPKSEAIAIFLGEGKYKGWWQSHPEYEGYKIVF